MFGFGFWLRLRCASLRTCASILRPLGGYLAASYGGPPITTFEGRQGKSAPACAFGAKIGVFLGGNKFVNAYVERDKKNLKLAVFGVQVAAHLIEIVLTAENAETAENLATKRRKVF